MRNPQPTHLIIISSHNHLTKPLRRRKTEKNKISYYHIIQSNSTNFRVHHKFRNQNINIAKIYNSPVDINTMKIY